MKQIEVVAAIIKKDNKILATQRGYGNFKGWWEFPGGKIEENESKEEALKREIKEELNAEIVIDSFYKTIEYKHQDFYLILHCYFCSLISNSIHLIEHQNYKWVTKEELKDLNWLPADIEIISSLY